VNVENIADLAKIRHWAARLDADDERLTPDHVVMILRNGATVARISCSSDTLAWTAYRLCAGLRFKRENAAEWAASEFAALDASLPLAA
jgi:hypothetical protein